MKRAIACASVLAFVCLFSITALGANTEQVVLRVGQVESSPSLPTEFMESFRPGMQIVPAYQSRSEVWPSTTPLPSALTELPDVVSVLVGFYDNDIPSLCEAEALEPLDSLLEEAGINPAEDLPAEVRAAVTWQGKTWAIPYRIESFVLQYRLDAR